MKDFKAISFDLIDINVNSSPDIFINRTNITFSKRVLEDMNYPSYAQYCINSEQKVFAIRACKSNESKAVAFSKPKADQTQTLNSSNKNIVEPIKALLPPAAPNTRYRIQGHYDSETRTMYFDLEDAVEELFRANKKAALT